MQKICVIGLGYIGLPTASLIATKGMQVHGVDIRPEVVETINQGNIHIHEPDLDVLVKAAVQSGNLRAATQPKEADVFIIAVPTPFHDNFKPDISYVEQATKAMAPYLRPGNLVILESTSPVGTTHKIGEWLRESGVDTKDIYLAHCPERVLPGKILNELVTNDRIIGGIDRASSLAAEKFYRQFVSGAILLTEAKTAELSKLTENAFRDVNIAFANELSLICEKMGIDVWELISLANRHPRVNILQPGPGVGGHCIAVDPWFIVDGAPEEARLIRTAREVNDQKPRHVIKKVLAKAHQLGARKVACLGLAFKADIDDLRGSPALDIVAELADKNSFEVLAVEPHISSLPPSLKKFPNLRLCPLEEAVGSADLLVLLVNHQIFVKLDPKSLQGKAWIDTRGVWK